ncbi:response regulator containing a CheY-like receiver domain and an HD-GYP domain [Desulfosporosinus acidiphilus SJ4]|uniref:Response regulator containing a CheY-like receiver domain and an HD-GYP domain n=1 Tax=Desulfosporosinus acidiphilus (strain DSM 22704 / JCM 16185 / SJ4) TaxID=646529 RepID=I4D1D8_DESAJ|nr:HD domain-containing phosphohydrolase [Desulfosporosinus acidiphilus]AFM39612.1 response regulator containing a CheY-like receiver domain and an HD-GYP domain [Desulfosporosinus acidiphilus SJ4]
MKRFSTQPGEDSFIIRKLIRQNLVYLLVILLLLIIFGISLYFGTRQVYEEEEQWRSQKTMAEVASGKTNISEYFLDFRRDLDFILSLPNVKSYFNENFNPSKRSGAEKLLSSFSDSKKLYQMTVTNLSGAETLKVEGSTKRKSTWSDGMSNEELHRKLFEKAITLNKGQETLSPIYYGTVKEGANTTKRVLMTLAMPIYDDRSVKGVLFIDIDLMNVFEVLPNTQLFLQTDYGADIFLDQKTGLLNVQRLGYDLTGNKGWYPVTDLEMIHYSWVKVFSDQPFIIAEYHQLPLLKVTLGKFIYLFGAICVVFLSLIILSIFTTFSVVKKTINTQKAIVFSLATLAEGRDSETGKHLERSRDYAMIIARQLSTTKRYNKVITHDFLDNLYYAAALHDIGKVAVPDAVLLKEGKLTDAEYQEMKKHVRTGQNLLRETIEKYHLTESFIEMGMNICAYHHEKFNGRGYPEGLAGEEIPLEARIFALCDAYDAIRSKRSYKKGLSHQEAVERIVADKNQHFDPEVVEAFLQCEEKLLAIT